MTLECKLRQSEPGWYFHTKVPNGRVKGTERLQNIIPFGAPPILKYLIKNVLIQAGSLESCLAVELFWPCLLSVP